MFHLQHKAMSLSFLTSSGGNSSGLIGKYRDKATTPKSPT